MRSLRLQPPALLPRLAGALGLLLLALAWTPRAEAQLLELPTSAQPRAIRLDEDLSEMPAGREEALLCYHQGSTYYVKQPHPNSGNVGPLFQRVTPGSSGHMDAFELRLYNNFPGNLRHEGLVQLTVHRRVGMLPGPFEMLVEFATDTVVTGEVWVPLETPFDFAQGEEFFLGMTYLPAAGLDTIAYVTAGLDSYTGHSFFMQNGQLLWWGAPDGTPFGDMHFCAQVWLDNQQAYLQFPWNRLDLGRSPAGLTQETLLPVLNQGTAPLAVTASVFGEGWQARLVGPDSLMPPDTLFLRLSWEGPAYESVGEGMLLLETNATNNPVRSIPLKATTSLAHLLVSNWDEWSYGVEQLLDSSDQDHSWRLVRGLSRPDPFMGHDAPPNGQTCRDVLYLGSLRLQEGAACHLRWSQYRRHSSGTREHAFCWRLAGTTNWVVAGPDLDQDPWLGPADEWWTTPWLEWQAPRSGEYEMGLLYGGEGAYDRWYVDDLELRVTGALATPLLGVSRSGGNLRLEWEPVLGAAGYRVDRVDCRPPLLQGRTQGLGWNLGKEQRRGGGCYRVTAESDEIELWEE